MTGEKREFRCSGCDRVLDVGDIVFTRDMGIVEESSVNMLPMTGHYCRDCAISRLGMMPTEILEATTAIQAHVQELERG